MKTRLLAILTLILSITLSFTHGATAGLVCSTLGAAALMPRTGYAFILTGPITLLDLAIRNGDNVGAVVEDVTTVAPEWTIVPAVPQDGTSYDVLRRVGLPAGAFRNVGEGVDQSKSEWARETKPMFFFDAQMDIDEAVVQAQTAQSMAKVGDVLADEAQATVQGSALNFGKQFYYGVKADAKGFVGLATQVSDEVQAGGGTSGNTTSAYLIWLDPDQLNPKGVHFRIGRKGAFSFGDWMKQQVVISDKKAMHYVNNFSFYVGACAASVKSIFRVKRIRSGFGWTDALGAELISKVPISRRANLRWFANPNAGWTLQQSRTTDLVKNVPLPTECQGIPITYTDSIVNTETDGNLA